MNTETSFAPRNPNSSHVLFRWRFVVYNIYSCIYLYIICIICRVWSFSLQARAFKRQRTHSETFKNATVPSSSPSLVEGHIAEASALSDWREREREVEGSERRKDVFEKCVNVARGCFVPAVSWENNRLSRWPLGPDKLDRTSPPLPVKIQLKIQRDKIRRERERGNNKNKSDLSVCNLFLLNPLSPPLRH